ncbi:MAG: amidohydrolase [Clostridiales Family XIII bacterium]|jgi:predicted amidohydrolase YtcJ|nr:amidohydrolase [Clostridiales Family XIII bacterium]
MSEYELLLKNANIITMDKDLSRKRWLAVRDGRIAATGTDDASAPAAKTVLDMGGKTVMPGLTDTHAHATMTGIGYRGVDLAGAGSVAEILERVEAFCGADRGGGVIFGGNLPMGEQLKEGRLPDRYELDGVSGGRPVMLVLWTVHGGVLNSAALPLARLAPEMAYVEKDGVFNDDHTAFHVIGNLYATLSEKDFRDIYFGIAADCAARGITTLHALDGMMVKDDKDTEVLKDILTELPIEFVPYTQTFDVDKIHGYGMKQIGGCLSLDGSPPQLTAAFSAPYPVAPHTRGFLNFTDEKLYRFVTECTKRDMQVGFHAIGDRAIDQILYIYRQVDRELGIRSLRHRIEHFSTPSERHMEMAAEMNIIATAQPGIGNMLDNENGNGFEAFAPPETARDIERFARVVRYGILTAGGSDSPVTPLDCFAGIDAAVNAFNPERRVTLDEALRMYTVNAAHTEHRENEKGSLEPGKYADMIIVSNDPYAVKGRISLDTVGLEATYKRGGIVYDALSIPKDPGNDPRPRAVRK